MKGLNVFMAWFSQDICFTQIDIKIQHNFRQNPNKFLCETWQTCSKIYKERKIVNVLLTNNNDGLALTVIKTAKR